MVCYEGFRRPSFWLHVGRGYGRRSFAPEWPGNGSGDPWGLNSAARTETPASPDRFLDGKICSLQFSPVARRYM